MKKPVGVERRSGTIDAMSDLESDVRKKLEALRAVFLGKMPERLALLRQLTDSLRRDERNARVIEEIRRAVHSLAGTGATFGFREISEAAHRAELELASLIAPEGKAETLAAAPVLLAMESVQLELHRAMDARHVAKASVPAREMPVSGTPAVQPLIYLLEDPSAVDGDLALQVSCFGYEVKTFNSLDALQEACCTLKPDLVIGDLLISKGASLPVPLIYLSEREDLESRLAAIQAGGKGYFTKPVDVVSLVHLLDRLTAQVVPESFRVLIVDDDESSCAHYAIMLQGMGMKTKAVHDPRQSFEALIEFQPDVLILDLYMPHCHGLDLALAIRQEEAYADLPIVFLSTEGDPSRQFQAFLRAGDDFVEKSSDATRLLASVVSRAQRYRNLRSLIARDGLTGLLNHSYVKLSVDREIDRLKRYGGVFSVAVLDVDHFKRINDRYGHPAGDRVLKTLAYSLQQGMRKTDLMGRYGGDEFVIGLLHVDPGGARQVVEKILKNFSLIRHRSGSEEFQVTLSAGVSGYPACLSTESMIDAADQALYQAKAGGRNRVALASQGTPLVP